MMRARSAQSCRIAASIAAASMACMQSIIDTNDYWNREVLADQIHDLRS